MEVSTELVEIATKLVEVSTNLREVGRGAHPLFAAAALADLLQW